MSDDDIKDDRLTFILSVIADLNEKKRIRNLSRKKKFDDPEECIVAINSEHDYRILAGRARFEEGDLWDLTDAITGETVRWERDLAVGVYKLTVRSWSYEDFESDKEDCGCEMVKIVPLWQASAELLAGMRDWT